MKLVFARIAFALALMAILFPLTGGRPAMAQNGDDREERIKQVELRHQRVLERELATDFAASLGDQQEINLAAEPALVPPEGEANVFTWGTMAFESYRSGNWDIWVAYGQPVYLRQLTFTAAEDASPRFNRDATRIVFSSKRDGDWEIFTMNADGSGLRQLTYNNAIDSDPVWSPDGKRIAFSSNRTGNYEVFVMNADGSNVFNLSNSSAFDAAPTWSPDGTAIIYAYDNGYASYLRRVAPDGHGREDVIGPLNAADYPVYALDGKSVAFAGDNNHDGFLELLWLELESGGVFVNASGAYEDMIPSSFWPDGVVLSYTLFHYRFDYDHLVMDSFALYSARYKDSSGNYILNNGPDLSAGWGNRDLTPPVARIPQVPEMNPSQTRLPLTVSDNESGFRDYIIQYRLDGSPSWVNATDWLDYYDIYGYTKTVGLDSVPMGKPLTLRVLARDFALNTSTSNEIHLTTYWVGLLGQAMDMREHPIYGAQAAASIPTVLPITPSDARGRFGVYFPGAMYTYTIGTHSVSASGYGAVPPAEFILEDKDANVQWVLPPLDNRITNGQFENGNLDGWTLSGTGDPYAVATSELYAHSGGSMLRLSTGGIANLSNSDPILFDAGARNPTLSFFWYDYHYDTAFWVEVNGSEVVRVAEPDHTPDDRWHHVWVDLSPWKGQPITISFVITPPSPCCVRSQVYIDEVAVGEAKGPIVNTVAPAVLYTDEPPYHLTISGMNFEDGIRAFLDETELNVVSVSETSIQASANTLAFGYHTLWVQNSSGQRAAYQQRVFVGVQVYVPVVTR